MQIEKVMELEKINYYFNWNTIFRIVGSALLPISIFGIFTLLQWHKSRQRTPPGPVGLPFVGYLPLLGKEPHKTFWNLRKQYGDIISVYLGKKYTVVLNEYNVMKAVMSHPGSLDRPSDLFNHFLKTGFSVENGRIWAEQRRFTMATLKDLGLGRHAWENLIMDELSRFIQKLRDFKGKPADISELLVRSLNSSFLFLLVGRRLGEDEEDKIHLSVKYAETALINVSPSHPTSLMPALRKVYETFRIGNYGKALKITQQFSSFLKEEIKRHKDSPLLKNVPDFINVYMKKISELSKADNKEHAFSERMLEGNLALVLLGGSDTMHSSLGWMMRLMCQHKDVQERVHAELIDILGRDGKARYEERDKIPYTFAVLMEGLRHASNVPLSTTRKANQDIPINGYIIPKGSHITANTWGLHHDPAYWDQPEEFRPERFLAEGGSKLVKQPPSYVPFSLGRRNCPGETIAWMGMLLYFAEILKRFEVSTLPGVEPSFEIVDGLVTRLAPQPLCFKERNV